ncbi:MAG: hypothetical protein IKK49_03350 [Clostridia bacterium]|nr:hypothetical protein [Clostridia bacterium]
MKRALSLVLSLTLILLIFGGCAEAETLHTIDLSVMPTNEYLEIDVKEVDGYAVKFLLPEDGYLKLLNCDITEYEYWDTSVWPEFYVTFKTAGGKVLFENIATSGGYCEKYRFEKGEVIAEISIENKLEDMETLALSWAYAPDTDEPVEIKVDREMAAARMNADGVAAFSFTVDRPAVYSFCPTEACIYEGNCDFRIETPDGEKVTGEINILGTEWAYRRTFLTEGDYILKVTGIDSVASCKIKTDLVADGAILQDEEDLAVPVMFGYPGLESRTRTVTFNTADGEKLIVEPYGTGNYYEYEHTAYVEILDSEGNVIASSDEETDEYLSTYVFFFDGYEGEYTAAITAGGGCIVDVYVK